MKFLTRFILSQIFLILLCFPANAQKFNIFASPLPPYSINKGLHLNGIAVDTLAIIMPLSGVNMTTRDVKLMLWKYALKITKKGPRTIMLNVPRTAEFDPLFKWVGPVLVEKYVVIGHKKGDKAFSLSDLDGSKVGTIRGSAPEKALIGRRGADISTQTSSNPGHSHHTTQITTARLPCPQRFCHHLPDGKNGHEDTRLQSAIHPAKSRTPTLPSAKT